MQPSFLHDIPPKPEAQPQSATNTAALHNHGNASTDLSNRSSEISPPNAAAASKAPLPQPDSVPGPASSMPPSTASPDRPLSSPHSPTKAAALAEDYTLLSDGPIINPSAVSLNPDKKKDDCSSILLHLTSAKIGNPTIAATDQATKSLERLSSSSSLGTFRGIATAITTHSQAPASRLRTLEDIGAKKSSHHPSNSYPTASTRESRSGSGSLRTVNRTAVGTQSTVSNTLGGAGSEATRSGAASPSSTAAQGI
ncbi:hypothetical protein ABVK25_006592 [Lepraria finkii]|uniref:Uncharacterized protein n=1 Tax=Lepraria finkii TaxID=1340010 RepID=A0ABR4B7C4_9LECA